MRVIVPRPLVLLIAAACTGDGAPPLDTRPAGPIPCPLDASDTSGACWRQAAPYGSGAFPGAWRPGKFPLGVTPVVAFGGELWMAARTEVWSSPDGLTFSVRAKDDWGERIGHAVVFWKGQLWMFGGLAYEARTFLDDVWRSTDGARWEKAGDAAWPGREGHTVVAFRDRLWLLGGAVHIAADRSPDGYVNDVWSSEDGLRWTEVAAHAPWPPMDVPQAQVFQDALLVVGGQGDAGVWRTSDGVAWERLAPRGETWQARYDQGTAVLGGQLWVFGGEPAPRAARHAGVPIPALNDVWHSTDARTWRRQTDHGPWSPRSTRTSVVFHDALWIFSGKRTGARDNWGGDVWTMDLARQP